MQNRGSEKNKKLYDITTYLWNIKKQSQTHKNRVEWWLQGLELGQVGDAVKGRFLTSR